MHTRAVRLFLTLSRRARSQKGKKIFISAESVVNENKIQAFHLRAHPAEECFLCILRALLFALLNLISQAHTAHYFGRLNNAPLFARWLALLWGNFAN